MLLYLCCYNKLEKFSFIDYYKRLVETVTKLTLLMRRSNYLYMTTI